MSRPAAAAAEAAARSCLLGLGSNVGQRREHLQAAVSGLQQAGVALSASSSCYDTDPVGELLDQPSFLNACVLGSCALAPLALLDCVKRLERAIGRQPGGLRHAPRPIDIDILMLGEIECSDERMSLPHAQLLHRRFVLVPALELDFGMRTPDGSSLADALVALPLGEGVRWHSPPLAIGPDIPGDAAGR